MNHDVLSVDNNKKEITVRNLQTGEVFNDHYDKLIVATGT
jgi:NADH dehydrogenase FAD-containing subunit